MVVRQRAGGRRQERQVGDGRGQAELEQGSGPSDVARLANAQLHQTGDAMLHHLAPSSDFGKGRTGLDLTRLLEQRLVRVELHHPSTPTARALWSEWTRRARLGGKYKQATAVFGWSQIAGDLSAGAGASLSL